ncbi:MAG: response regulator [Nitrospinota bacterium]
MKIKILVVDDEPEITESLVRILRIEGYDATGVTNPLTALEMVKKENYLIVISDIQMPEMRGTELLRSIKEYNGMIQVIIITGYVTIDNILTCLRRGANDCFFKPLKDSKELLNAVKVATGKLERWEQVISEMVRVKAAS